MTGLATSWRPGDGYHALERKLVELAANSEPLDLIGNGGVPSFADMRAWGPDRSVRAGVIRYLLVDHGLSAAAKGIEIRGVRIDGCLNLENEQELRALKLDCCSLDDAGGLVVDRARVPVLAITRSWLATLSGEGLAVRGDLDLRGTSVPGVVSLPGAHVTGSLRCEGSALGIALDPDSDLNALVGIAMSVRGDVRLSGGFTASGAVRLTQAEISGSLYCGTADLGCNKEGNGLGARGLRVGGNVYLRTGFVTGGAVWLGGAEVTGEMICTGARLGANADNDSLFGDAMRVGRDLVLDDVHASGAIRLNRAVISGKLSAVSAHVGANKNNGRALACDEVVVRSHARLARLTTCGVARFTLGDVLGHLDLTGAQLHGRDDDGDSLILSRMRVGGSVFLTNASTTGAALLVQARITGQLRCNAADLGRSKRGTSLLGDAMHVGDNVHFDDGFTAAGAVLLRRARISGDLCWAPAQAPGGEVDLEGAQAHRVKDDWRGERAASCAYWPTKGTHLAGFRYDGFGSDEPASAAQRIDWISRQYRPRTGDGGAAKNASDDTSSETPRELADRRLGVPFATEPYKQLAEVYRRAGQDDNARAVEIARRRALRTYENLDRYHWTMNWLSYHTIRYGFETWRAARWLLVLYATVFVGLCAAEHGRGLIMPIDPTATHVHHVTAENCQGGRWYPCFYPAGYAADVVIPGVNLYETASWRPSGSGMTAAIWSATALGWLLTTVMIVGYSGLARRD